MTLFSLLFLFSLLPSPFSPGEKLIFDVSYGFIHLGTIKMEVLRTDSIRGKNVYVFRMTSKTEGTGALFIVADTIYSFVDIDSMYTLRYEKKLKEGHFSDSLVIDCYPDSGFATYSRGKRKREKILKGAIDPLGLYYLIRRLRIKSKDTITVPYHVDRRNKHVHIFVEGIRTCKHRGKKTKCYVLKPDLGGGIIKGGGKAEIYLTADSLRLPVFMKSKLYFGSLKVKLKKYLVQPVKENILHIMGPQNAPFNNTEQQE